MYFRRSRAKDRIAHLVGCNGRAVLRAEEKPPKAKNDAELAGNNQSDLNDQLRSTLWGGECETSIENSLYCTIYLLPNCRCSISKSLTTLTIVSSHWSLAQSEAIYPPPA